MCKTKIKMENNIITSCLHSHESRGALLTINRVLQKNYSHIENNIIGEPSLPFYMEDSTKQDINLECEISWRGYVFRSEF